jgi:hypothetical protein
MTKRGSRPAHLSTEEKPPENITHRVISPITWHYPPLELNLMSPDRVAAVVAGRTTFDAELLLARQYRAWAWNSRQSVITCDLAEEAWDKLEQLNFLLKSAYALIGETFVRPARQDVEGIRRQHHACFLLELYTEGFYYFSHRLQTVLEDKHGCLPHITGFERVQEIQIVRNQLLEHVEGEHSGITERRWTFSLNVGPMIKIIRRPDQPTSHKDPGLYPTAEKLRSAVAQVYKRALGTVAAEPATYPPFVEQREPTA